ncbi:hypothetical protein MHYP_G00089530 [Metynnis hypsauchen]
MEASTPAHADPVLTNITAQTGGNICAPLLHGNHFQGSVTVVNITGGQEASSLSISNAQAEGSPDAPALSEGQGHRVGEQNCDWGIGSAVIERTGDSEASHEAWRLAGHGTQKFGMSGKAVLAAYTRWVAPTCSSTDGATRTSSNAGGAAPASSMSSGGGKAEQRRRTPVLLKTIT